MFDTRVGRKEGNENIIGFEVFTTVQDLPIEVNIEIFKKLTLRDAASVFLTQKSWNVSEDIFFNYAKHLGFEGERKEGANFLKGLFANIKAACQNGDIPKELIVYEDAETGKIAYEQTLFNLLNKETILELVFAIAHNPHDVKDENRAIALIDRGGYNFFKTKMQNYSFLMQSLSSLAARGAVVQQPETQVKSNREAFVLAVASVTGYIEGIDLLLKCGVDVNTAYEGYPKTVLSLTHQYAYTYSVDKEMHNKTNAFLKAHGGREEINPITLMN